MCLVRDGFRSTEELEGTALQDWAESNRSAYEAARWNPTEFEITGSSPMDEDVITAADYDLGYEILVEYQPDANIANPMHTEVVERDDQWYVLYG